MWGIILEFFLDILGAFAWGTPSKKKKNNGNIESSPWDDYVCVITFIVFIIVSIILYSYIKINIWLYLLVAFISIIFFTIIITELISRIIYKGKKKGGK